MICCREFFWHDGTQQVYKGTFNLSYFFSKNPFLVQMGNSGFYQIVFRGRCKFPQVRGTENIAIKEPFYWIVGI